MSAKWSLAPALVCALLGANAVAQSADAGMPTASSGKRPVHVPAAAPLSPSAPIVFPVLYTQADNDSGVGVVSQDFETANDVYDSEGADDFVVPDGVTWAVMSVTANGVYFNGAGPAPAVNLTIFADNAGVPGAVECAYPLQTPADSAGVFTFTLPTTCYLVSGTYWIDVQARMDFAAGGEWGWESRSVQSNAAALWKNPGDGLGTGCTTFGSPMNSCITAAGGPDFLFSLSGNAVALTPTALLVDTTGAGSLNGVLEMGETATIAPTWHNGGADTFALQGLVSDFSGPAGANYVVDDGSADYGAIAASANANCETATADCIALHIDGTRPAQHFDAKLTEQPTVGFFAPLPGDALPAMIWTLHVGGSFDDVASSDPFYRYIETIFHFGVTGGCGAPGYCPGTSVTRAQMAVFLLKAKNGAAYTPPACTGTVFPDVPCTGGIFDPWIEDLAGQGFTGGCAGGNYCPGNPVTRAQMAVFLLKVKQGGPYVPPACTGTVFTDVPCTGGIFDPWIEDLAGRGVTSGCGGDLYCPGNANTRGQMAVFLTKTFSLVLYGP